ncbi:MAG: folate family ECF transporter S component [Candidatus Eremiobacterota bacterium]
MSARRLTWAAMFVALTLVMDLLPGPPGPWGNFFKFVGFPVILSGLVLGPAGGFLVGAVSDVLGYVLSPPSGVFFPGFTLTQALTGALPALFYRHSLRMVSVDPGSGRWVCFGLLTGSIVCAKLVSSVTLVSWFRHLLYGLPFWAYALPALAVTLAHAPLYAWASLLLMRNLERSAFPPV